MRRRQGHLRYLFSRHAQLFSVKQEMRFADDNGNASHDATLVEEKAARNSTLRPPRRPAQVQTVAERGASTSINAFRTLRAAPGKRRAGLSFLSKGPCVFQNKVCLGSTLSLSLSPKGFGSGESRDERGRDARPSPNGTIESVCEIARTGTSSRTLTVGHPKDASQPVSKPQRTFNGPVSGGDGCGGPRRRRQSPSHSSLSLSLVVL